MEFYRKKTHLRELQCYFSLGSNFPYVLKLLSFEPGDGESEVILVFSDVIEGKDMMDIKLGKLTSNPRLKTLSAMEHCHQKCLSSTSGEFGIRIKGSQTTDENGQTFVTKLEGRALRLCQVTSVLKEFVGPHASEIARELEDLQECISDIEQYLFGTSILLVREPEAVVMYLIDFAAVDFIDQVLKPRIAEGIDTLIELMQEEPHIEVCDGSELQP